MPSARDWPTKAEHTRQDVIALALDVQYLAREIQRANEAGDSVEVARLTQVQYRVGTKIQELLKEARRTQ